MKFTFTLFFIFSILSSNFSQFVEEEIIMSSNSSGARDITICDLDGDGDKDIVYYATISNRILWSENISEDNYFKQSISILDSVYSVSHLNSGDFDNDGDIDIVFANKDANSIYWLKNLNSTNSFSSPIVISDNTESVRKVEVVDVDGDNDLDIISASNGDNKIALFKNINGNGTFSSEIVINNQAIGAMMVLYGDLDSDGDLDLISCSRIDGKIVWYENIDSNGSYSSPILIDILTDVTRIAIADINLDGNLDIVAGSYGSEKIVWYDNIDGNAAFSPMNFIINYEDLYFLRTSDLDNDGDQDLLVCSYNDLNELVWYENIDGNGTFENKRTLIGGAGIYFFAVTDIDNDGDIDVVAPRPKGNTPITIFNHTGDLILIKNNGNPDNFEIKNLEFTLRYPCGLHVADIDGDGRKDIITAAGRVAWHKTLGHQPFQFKTKIAGYVPYPSGYGYHSVSSGDLDGDNDLDIIVSSKFTLRWYENIDGLGEFDFVSNISGETGDFKVVDMDNDGDMDIVGCSNYLYWWKNVDGLGNFSDKIEIHNEFLNSGHYKFTEVGDIDNDGDLDILIGIEHPIKEVYWIENINGFGNFSEGILISDESSGINPVHGKLGDIDNDGDLDIAISGGNEGLVWMENIDGQGSFDTPIYISTPNNSSGSLDIGDIDGDGDLDIIGVTSSSVGWHENLDGLGNFSALIPISTPSSFIVFETSLNDLDDDGDADLLNVLLNSTDGKFTYQENTSLISSINSQQTNLNNEVV